ncbi:MAG TPA: metalloregulator ArsR/SmtB family transcription factor [Candidatus Dormibacteraeota bacterium]|nr:metalloregulator ArsR/SmtB family transcription factor [Candidatus Dormibacteraeota bacterium]
MVEYPPRELDHVYGALSNSARRGLLERLAGSPARVTDLADSFPISLAGVSKHIRVLEEAGLVRREVRGREHLLTPNPAPLDGAATWLSDYRRFWEERLDLLDRRIRESRAK